MVVFLANRANLETKRLHDRITARLDSEFEDVQRRRTEQREMGQYRVVGEMDPQQLLGDGGYPSTVARLEIGFRLRPGEGHEHYWINWIEPDRTLLVGWHQDGTHDGLGPVHVRVNDGGAAVDRRPARFVDAHPLDILEQRLDALGGLVGAVEWDGGRPAGLDESAAEL